MRKIFSLFTVLALLALAVVPSFAQEQTIAEIVVASASGDAPEFTTLLAAVSAANPAVLEALSSPDAALTVFAPTDAAFATLQEALGDEAFNAVLADQDLLSSILLFHVVPGVAKSGDVVGLLEANEGKFSVGSAQGQYIDIATTEAGGITVNGANLLLDMVDIEASNGVIHVIDAVILPETRTIAELVVANSEAETPEFTTLLAAVSAADAAVLTTLSDPTATLTVFAPTDAAFAALQEALGDEAFNGVLADQAALTNILLYHVIPATVHSGNLQDEFAKMVDESMATDEPDMADISGWLVGATEDGGLEVTMANGASAEISADEDGIYINDAEIVITDIDAGNGVIHVIDAVIIPEAE